MSEAGRTNLRLQGNTEAFIELLRFIEGDREQIRSRRYGYLRPRYLGYTGLIDSYEDKPVGIASEKSLMWYVSSMKITRVTHYLIAPEELRRIEESNQVVGNSTSLYAFDLLLAAKRLISEGYRFVGVRTWNLIDDRLWPMLVASYPKRYGEIWGGILPWGTTVQPPASCFGDCPFGPDSDCGYYSYKPNYFLRETHGLLEQLYHGNLAMGIIVHFGTVYESRGGYRSSRARIKEIWCDTDKLDHEMYPGVRIHHVENLYDQI